jgi:hypothetical protein
VARSFAMNSQRFSFQTAKHVSASEAKQSIARHKERMDCFVASLLAMTKSLASAPFHPRAIYPDLM